MTDIARTCPICNTSFPATRGKRFCSRDCQLKGRAKPAELTTTTHIVIPDTQVRKGTPTIHLRWVGNYIGEKFGGLSGVKLRHLMDHWDMSSLSSYDNKGGTLMEGRRYTEDIDSGNEGWELLNDSITETAPAGWFPDEADGFLGNHEDRIDRACRQDAQLDGLMTLDHLACMHDKRWKIHPFLKPVWSDGIAYSHYFANQMTGRPLAGQSMDARIKTIGHSFTMGHQQGLWFGRRETLSGAHLGLVAGSCYLHDEDYKGPQGNNHWRGIIVCHNVEDGTYDPMFVSLDYLCRRYEGMRLRDFMARSEAA